MAHKSKTQRAKASAARAARKEARAAEELANESKPEVEAAVETPKKRFFGRKKEEPPKAAATKSEKKDAAPAKKKKKGFLSNVRSEMKRVTWPTKQDVLRWSVVVVCALLFFGITVAVLDNLIIMPVLVGISGLGA